MSPLGPFSRTAGAARRHGLGLLASLVAAAPAAAQTLVGDGTVACGEPYTISKGDTLSRLAARAYGDPMLYGFIADANWEALHGNPESIAVGMSVLVPCVDASGKVLTAEEAAKVAASIEAAVAAEGPLSPTELDALFGPVALFSDPLLTPVLVAATFPLDVVKAARFVEETDDLPDVDRVARAADQNWDNSVRELAAAFPDLVTRMSTNIDWTEQAGEAVVGQTDAVLESIQRLRTKAQENGYLVDNEAQKIEEVNDKIVISPATPDVVYVPTYDSKVVYTTPVTGAPVYHFGYDYGYSYGYVHDDDDWDDALIAGGIILGSAIILDEIFDDDDDWNGWHGDDDIDWDGGDITIDRDDIDVDIDRGEISIGDGDRQQIGDGGRVSIGDSDRPQIDRGDLAAGAAARTGHTSIANPANRDAAREKISARKSTGAPIPSLKPAFDPTRAASDGRSLTKARSKPGSAKSISRPSTSKPASVRTPSRSSSAFKQPSRSRPSASSSNRGRSSAGGGSRSGGGGGRRR